MGARRLRPRPAAAGAPFGSRLLGPADEPAVALRVRLQILTTAAIVTANLVGVGAVVVLNTWVLPRPEAMDRSTFVTFAASVPAYVVIAVAVGVVTGTRLAFRRVQWILDERGPDGGEQRAALHIPVALVAMQAALWVGGAVVFTALTLVLQPALAVGVGTSVVLGGLVTCTAAYLLTEFVMRPVSARALALEPAGRLAVPGVTARAMLAWALGSAVPVGGLMVVALLSIVRDDVSADRLALTVLVLGGVTLVVGALLTVLAVRAAVDPIRSLRLALARVREGDLDTEVVVYDGSEIGLLQASFNRMIAGLRERERIRDLFGRHVGEAVARDALSRSVELGGETREVSVLFVDVIGSTELAAARPPADVVNLLNRFFAVVVAVVDAEGGTVNKFEGDGALVVFGAPVDLAEHPDAALRAARHLHARLDEEVPECDAGIGVASGEVVAGNVGEERRFEYTVIGDPVNEAARLCDLAKNGEGRVLASMTTVERATTGERDRWSPAGEVTLRGRSSPTRTAVPHPAVPDHERSRSGLPPGVGTHGDQ